MLVRNWMRWSFWIMVEMVSTPNNNSKFEEWNWNLRWKNWCYEKKRWHYLRIKYWTYSEIKIYALHLLKRSANSQNVTSYFMNIIDNYWIQSNLQLWIIKRYRKIIMSMDWTLKYVFNFRFLISFFSLSNELGGHSFNGIF